MTLKDTANAPMPSIDRNSPIPFYQQIYEQIARGIDVGLYAAGKKLPSIRECARELDVSNTTVELAYQRLTEEGYVRARRGSGYTICETEAAPANVAEEYSGEYRASLMRLIEDEQQHGNQQQPRYDFAYDTVDKSIFPLAHWARISREVFFGNDAEGSCLYSDRQGLGLLREQIAHYLGSEYGLNCIAEQIIVMPTTRDIIASVLSLFNPAETTVAMEEPGYNEVARMLDALSFDVRLMPVYPRPTWPATRRFLDGVNAVFVTPASQFPTNRSMPIELRRGLVEWAEETGAYLIDDEYCWEFQSGGARVPSLAALDHTGRVITIGTFSNSFTPAVSLSYAVLPPTLMMEWRQRERSAHPQVPWQTQAAMAAFMSDDLWRKHMRRMRTSAQNKRAKLVSSIETHMGDAVEVIEGENSLFALVQTHDGRSEDELVEAAALAGVNVYPTSQYWSGEVPESWRYVLVGYAGISIDQIGPGITVLARAWGLKA